MDTYARDPVAHRLLRLRIVLIALAVTVGFEYDSPAGAPEFHAVGTAGPDVAIADSDTTLGPWLGESDSRLGARPARAPSRPVPLGELIRATRPTITLDAASLEQIRRRVAALRQSIELIDQQLMRIRSSVTRLQSLPAPDPRPEPIADGGNGVRRIPLALHAQIGRDDYSATPLRTDPFHFSDLGVVGGPPLDLESDPLEDAVVQDVLAAPPMTAAMWVPSNRLVEIFLQSAAIAFLAAVLLAPLGCWLTNSSVSRRSRRTSP